MLRMFSGLRIWASGSRASLGGARGLAADRRNRRIVLSASAGVGQRLAQVAATFFLMPILLRVLGPAQFGIWGAAASLAWLAGFSDMGTGPALLTLVARSTASNDAAEARRYITGALIFGCGLTGLAGLATLMAWIALPQIRYGPYFIAAIGLALNIPLTAANSVWMALQKGYSSAFWELVQTLLTLAGVFAAAAWTRDVRVYVAIVYGSLVLGNLGSLVHLFVRHSELRPEGLVAPLSSVKAVAGPGVGYFMLALAGGLFYLLDNILALALLGPEASARMTIALRICIAATGALVAISQPLWPAFSEAAAAHDWHWIRSMLIRGSALLVGISIAGSSILLVYGRRLLGWWLHQSLGITRSLLWAIAGWVIAQALLRVPCLLLNALSIIRYQIVLASAGLLFALALKLFLSSRLGVAGILWGTTAPLLLIILPAFMWRIFSWATHADGGNPASVTEVVG
jgi:O-antigen/teichoic acid export membrane protein